MRRLLISIALSFGSPAAAAAADRNETAERARTEAVATLGLINDREQRASTAFYLSDAMILAGECRRARPLIAQFGRDRADPRQLLALFHSAARSDDRRCMASVAATLRLGALNNDYLPAERTRFGFLAAVLLRISGQAGRAERIEPANLEAVDFVAPESESTTLDLDRLTIHIGFADPATERQRMIMAAIGAYERTRFLRPMLEELAARAESEPNYLNQAGWTEVAVLLARAGNEDAALRLLDRNRGRALTRTGLHAELAVRSGRYGEAAALLSEPGQYYLRDEQRRAIIAASALELMPYISRHDYWDNNPLELADYSETLDAVGHRSEAERAALAALSMFTGNHDDPSFCSRKARLLARLRRFEEASACLRRVATDRRRSGDAILVAGRIVQGLAANEDFSPIQTLLSGYRDDERIEILRRALSEGCRFSRAVQMRLAEDWARRSRGRDEGLVRAAVQGGCSADTLRQLAGEGPEGNRLLYNAAHVARLQNNLDLARLLAAPIPVDENTPDVVFGGLSRIHWVTGDPPRALAMARRVRDPALRARILIDGWMDMRLAR